jgi:hypothetical protein
MGRVKRDEIYEYLKNHAYSKFTPKQLAKVFSLKTGDEIKANTMSYNLRKLLDENPTNIKFLKSREGKTQQYYYWYEDHTLTIEENDETKVTVNLDKGEYDVEPIIPDDPDPETDQKEIEPQIEPQKNVEPQIEPQNLPDPTQFALCHFDLDKTVLFLRRLDEKKYPSIAWLIRRAKSGRTHPINEFIYLANNFLANVVTLKTGDVLP